MDSGPAAVWAEEFMAHAQTVVATAAGTQAANGYGTWAQFKTAFEENFGQIDLAGNAMTRLRQLKQKPNELSEYVAEFKQLSTKAGLTADLPCNQFFLDGLQQGLLNRFYQEEPPATFNGTVERVLKLKNRRLALLAMRERLGFVKPNQKKSYGSSCYTPNHARDPNAMDVDRMTDAERQDCFKNGLCFTCRKPGHRSTKCPEKMKKKTGDAGKNPKKGKSTVRQLPEDEEAQSADEETVDEEDEEDDSVDNRMMKDGSDDQDF